MPPQLSSLVGLIRDYTSGYFPLKKRRPNMLWCKRHIVDPHPCGIMHRTNQRRGNPIFVHWYLVLFQSQCH